MNECGDPGKEAKAKYTQAANLGSKEVLTQLISEASSVSLGFTRMEARKYLKELAKAGNKNAQKELNVAAACEQLGFTEIEGLKYLEKLMKTEGRNIDDCWGIMDPILDYTYLAILSRCPTITVSKLSCLIISELAHRGMEAGIYFLILL